jgi:predicted enzyme related to lactoylglutathione lyase
MAIVEKHPAGAFNWIELGTSDQNAAKKFYTSLFGWDLVDSPMGPNDFYTMFKVGGLDVAAAYTLRPMEVEKHVPPHWNLYIATEDADKTAARASELGATILAPPFDVFTFGRMAVIRDPAGAVFCIWQAKTHIGIRVKDQPGAFCWADLNIPDQTSQTKAVPFYEGLFGWKLEPGQADTSGYLHIKNGESFIGGVPPGSQLPPNIPPHWMVYFQVEDCAASTAKAKELGAHIYVDSLRLEKTGTFTILNDPQGAGFALFQPEPRSH